MTPRRADRALIMGEGPSLYRPVDAYGEARRRRAER
jgi:hypothetical protein